MIIKMLSNTVNLNRNIQSYIFRRIYQPSKQINTLRMMSNMPFKVGDEVKETRRFTSKDVATFAFVSGDNNPVHIDLDFVKQIGVFDGLLVHGALINGFISSLLGTRLPGPGTIAVSQEMRFPKPLYIDELVEGKVRVIGVKKRFVVCAIECNASGKIVLQGKATVMYPM